MCSSTLHTRPKPIIYRDLKARKPDARWQHRSRDADRFRYRALGGETGKGVTAVGTMGYARQELFSGRVETAFGRLWTGALRYLSSVDRRRPAGQPAADLRLHQKPARPRQIAPSISIGDGTHSDAGGRVQTGRSISLGW